MTMAFPSIIAKASKPIKNAKVMRVLSDKAIVLLVADITSNDEAQYSKLIQKDNSDNYVSNHKPKICLLLIATFFNLRPISVLPDS